MATFPEKCQRVIRDWFTEKDGKTYDLKRLLWVKSFLIFDGLSIYDVVVNKTQFDLTNFGIGLGAVLAAGGVALAMTGGQERPSGANEEDRR